MRHADSVFWVFVVGGWHIRCDSNVNTVKCYGAKRVILWDDRNDKILADRLTGRHSLKQRADHLESTLLFTT